VKSVLLAIAIGCLSNGANASPYIEQCSAVLSQQWHDAIAKHPIDPSKHVPVVVVYVPRTLPENSVRDALRGLATAFPSFKEAPGSGILIGCCSFPISGSISFEDLAKLSATNFAPLCAVGVASVQVRMEDRDTFGAGIGAAPYFWISY
jgi:hypothetical protein